MSFPDDLIGDVTGLAGGAVNDLEGLTGGISQAAEGLLGSPAGSLVGSLLGDIGSGGASLFGQLPELSGLLSGLSGLTGSQSPAQQFAGGGLQTAPYLWSQASSGIPSSLFNDPQELSSSLNSAGSKIQSGFGLGGFNAGAIDQQVNGLQNQANTDAQNGNILQAQQESEQAMLIEQMVSQLMKDQADMAKQAIQNFAA